MIFFEKIYKRIKFQKTYSLNLYSMVSLLSIFLFFSNVGISQITLLNRSFEDQPSDATIPQGWFGCELFTTPDILPGYWGVYNTPSEGNTYIGLITRKNGSWESIGQRLSKSLEEKVCYVFSIDLAHSFIYAGYDKPIKLKIWLGSNLCQKDQLIFESPKIDQEEWKTYKVQFAPDRKYDYLILEASKGEIEGFPKGNILIDNMSIIKFCGRV